MTHFEEHAYLEYLLNKPDRLEEGQIWKYPEKNLEFVITDIISENVVRAVVLCKWPSLKDQHDVSLKGDTTADRVFPRERFSLRITDGPVPASVLQVYSGKLDPETFRKVKQSLRVKEFNYAEEQWDGINEIMDALEPLRQKALDDYLD